MLILTSFLPFFLVECCFLFALQWQWSEQTNWKQLFIPGSCNTTLGFANPGSYSTSYCPPGRWYSSGFLYLPTNTLFIYGGRGVDAPSFGDMWAFRLDTKDWAFVVGTDALNYAGNSTYVPGQPGLPRGRSAMGYAATDNAFYIFGGYGGAAFSTQSVALTHLT